MKKHIPNLLTALRIIFSPMLLIFPGIFTPLYVFIGVTDMLDGYLARRLDCESAFGSRLDSIADIVFLSMCGVKLIPLLTLPVWLWTCVCVVGAVKLSSLAISTVKLKKPLMLHTKGEKLTGLMLFVLPLFIGRACFPVCAAAVCTAAFFAAVHELFLLLKMLKLPA